MRIGIVGSGMIVGVILDVWEKLGGIEPAALWCRQKDEERTREMAGRRHIASVYTDYDAFLASEDFDFVYIGLVNSLHYEYSKHALLAGKGVICEKPFTSTEAQAQELLDIARERGLFLFESVLPWYQDNYWATRDCVDELGRMKLVQVSFSQYSRRYERYLAGQVLPVFDPALDGGCLMDIMVYSVHYVMGIFGEPKAVRYFANLGYNGIDLSGVLVMDYGDFKAVLTSAKDSASSPSCIIQGDGGFIRMPHEPGTVKDVELCVRGQEPVTIDVSPEEQEASFALIWQKVLTEVQSGDVSRCLAYTEQVVRVMAVMEKARLDAGIKFPCDEKK